MPKTNQPYVTVLTLCEYAIAKWTTQYQNGNTLASLVGNTFSQGQASLDQFQGDTLTFALLHELAHAPAIVGDGYMLDEDCSVDGKTRNAYGWDCITQLAQNAPGSAINNAGMRNCSRSKEALANRVFLSHVRFLCVLCYW